MNNSVTRAHGMTAFEACYGWSPYSPLSLALKLSANEAATEVAESWVDR